jgi:hypothetical protein
MNLFRRERGFTRPLYVAARVHLAATWRDITPGGPDHEIASTAASSSPQAADAVERPSAGREGKMNAAV